MQEGSKISANIRSELKVSLQPPVFFFLYCQLLMYLIKARSGMNIMIKTLANSFLEMQMLTMESIKRKKEKEDELLFYVSNMDEKILINTEDQILRAPNLVQAFSMSPRIFSSLVSLSLFSASNSSLTLLTRSFIVSNIMFSLSSLEDLSYFKTSSIFCISSPTFLTRLLSCYSLISVSCLINSYNLGRSFLDRNNGILRDSS